MLMTSQTSWSQFWSRRNSPHSELEPRNLVEMFKLKLINPNPGRCRRCSAATQFKVSKHPAVRAKMFTYRAVEAIMELLNSNPNMENNCFHPQQIKH